MRIIHKHYAQVLIGYDRVQEFSQKFQADWAAKAQPLENEYRQKLEEYNQRLSRWQAAKKLVEDRYQRLYEAWSLAEAPNRETYKQNEARWINRHAKAVKKLEAQLQSARARQKSYRTWFWVCAGLSLLVIPAVVTLPAAVVLAILFFNVRGVAQARSYRRNAVHALLPPAFQPHQEEPPKPLITPAPTPPERAAHHPLPRPMMDAWWESLQQTPPHVQNVEQKKEGDEGEALLVEELARVLPDDFITIPGAMVEPGTDADVVVIGRNGIWILDSKYYAGTVHYHPPRWWQEKTFFPKGGGAQETTVKELPDLEDEWLREQKSVIKTLKLRMLREHPPITGGLAFTYNAALDIDESCPVTYHSASEWCEIIAGMPCEEKYTERDLVECAHHILTFSHDVLHDNTASALDAAVALRDEYSQELRAAFG